MYECRIDSCFIAKLILDFNQKVLYQDYVSREEIYEVRILFQIKLNELGSNIVILDELDKDIFEERNGICFYVGDKTKATIDAYFLNYEELLYLSKATESLSKDIINCILEVKRRCIKKIESCI